MERLYSQGRVEVQSLSPESSSLPTKFKVCIDVEVPGQKAIKKLTDSERAKLGERIAPWIADVCPGREPIFVTIDAARDGVVNVAVYTDALSDIHALRDAKGIYPLCAYNISNPEDPKPLLEKEWMKG